MGSCRSYEGLKNEISKLMFHYLESFNVNNSPSLSIYKHLTIRLSLTCSVTSQGNHWKFILFGQRAKHRFPQGTINQSLLQMIFGEVSEHVGDEQPYIITIQNEIKLIMNCYVLQLSILYYSV